MTNGGAKWRFWLPIALLGLFYAYVVQKLVRAHLDADVSAPRYEFKRSIPGGKCAV